MTIFQVVSRSNDAYQLDLSDVTYARQLASAYANTQELREVGVSQGVKVEAEVHVGGEPERVILEFAQQQAIDLIIVGTDLRPAPTRTFLGPRVERILDRAPCPVIVFNIR